MTFYNQKTANNMKYGAINRESPANNLVSVTPSDVTVYDPPLRGFRVGVAGNVAVLTYDDYLQGLNTAKTIPCSAGTDTPLYVAKIYETGTDLGLNIKGYRP